jgi:hypothetical protein
MSAKVARKGLTPLIIILVLLVVAVGAYVLNTRQRNPTTQTPTPGVSQDEMTLSGRVVDVDTSCQYDGVCKVKVDNYWIITTMGGDLSPEMLEKLGPRGSIIGAGGETIGNHLIGKEVEVFAKVIDATTLTLYGKKEYYIRYKN